MYCMHCGASLQPGQVFCSACGKAVESTAQQIPQSSPQPYRQAAYPPPAQAYVPPAAQGRIAAHLRTLAILWLIVSGIHLFSGFRLFTFGRFGLAFFHVPFAPFLTPLLSVLGVVAMVSAVVGLLVGWALLQRESWGRMLAIILGIIILPRIPFGTALGIYTLWVLLPAQSEAEYRQIARQA
ncbi:MAG: zinc-ribbon domain-containing protein [Terriglobia bacterium]